MRTRELTVLHACYRRVTGRQLQGSYCCSREVCRANVQGNGLPSPHRVGYAILAMSHFKLDEKQKANEYREKLNETMKLYAFKADKECKSFAQEVADWFSDLSSTEETDARKGIRFSNTGEGNRSAKRFFDNCGPKTLIHAGRMIPVLSMAVYL